MIASININRLSQNLRSIGSFLLLALIAVFAYSCEEVKGEPIEYPIKEKTVLVYMVGNNNLSGTAETNLIDMKRGFIPEENEGNIVAYYHIQNQDPLLLNIYKDETGQVAVDTAYRFPPRNSATATSLKNAMQVTQTMFPANEYGLILWSHGTGWLPEGHYSKTKSFGSEYDNTTSSYKEINIQDLVKAMAYKTSYVIFDACLMGGIETAYEFKDSTDYLLFSPAEILEQGFPYAKIMQHLFSNPTDLESVAKEFYHYYNSQVGQMKSATVSLVKTSELENVAAAAKTIFDEHREKIATLDMGNIQRYFRRNKHWFYDIEDFMNQLGTPEQAATFKEALEKAVIYKAATPYFIDIHITKYSGISTYVPNPADEELDPFYQTLKWNKACNMIPEQTENE